jgi:VanZ family protein
LSRLGSGTIFGRSGMRLLTAYLPALIWSLVVASLAGATDLPGAPGIPHLDKLAHFGVYAVLGVLLGWGWLRAGRRPGRGWLLLFALLLGASDEVRHHRMDQRQAEFGDWIADALGAAAGLFITTRYGRRLMTNDDTDDE